MANEKSEDLSSISRKRRRKEMQLHVNTSKGPDHQNAIEALEKAMETLPTVQSSSQRNQLEILFEVRLSYFHRIINYFLPIDAELLTVFWYFHTFHDTITAHDGALGRKENLMKYPEL